jgi:glycosyltransferase involved in cell wall biosynthesis
MRVGYIFNSSRVIGGGEISLIDLIDAVRDQSVDPVVFVPGNGEVADRLKDLGITPVVTPFPSLRGVGLFRMRLRVRELACAFKDNGLDIVHANGARCMLYAGPASGRASVPCVWHVRVIERDGILDRSRAKHSSTIIANSRAVAASLGPYVRNRDVVRVVYNGFNLTAIDSSDPADIRREYGIPPGPIVLGAGRFTRWKAFEDLIHAFAVLRRRGVESSLVLAGSALPGESGYEGELKALARECGAKKVFFTGWRDDIPGVMKSADVFVLPSHREPFGRVIVEAMASGLPVVAAGTGGPAEIVTDGKDGVLVEEGCCEAIADGVERILSDAELRDSLIAAGRRRAEQFSLVRHVAGVVGIYRELTRARS